MSRRRAMQAGFAKRRQWMLDHSDVPLSDNLTAGLAAWRSLRETNAVVLVLGDSIGAGAGVASPAVNGWAAKLFASLKAEYGDGGTFVSTWQDLVSIDERTLWAFAGDFSAGGMGVHDSVDNYGSTGTATVAVTGTAVDIFSMGGMAFSGFTLAIDGGPPQDVGGGGATFEHKKTSFTGLEAGSHTLVFGKGAGYATLTGIAARTGAGLLTVNSSRSSARIADRDDVMAGAYFIAQTGLMAAGLTIVALTVNDFLGQTALSAYRASLEAVAGHVGSGSVLLLAENPMGEVRTIPHEAYVRVMYETAKKLGCAFLNINRRWGSYAAAVAAGTMGGDTVHPVQAGHDDYFGWLDAVLKA